MTIAIQGLTPLIQVFDMPTSIRFYRDTLGFQVTSTSSPGDDCNWALLKLDGTPLMLNTAYDPGTRPPKPDSARFSAHGDTIIFFGCPDVDAAYEHLRSRGVDAKKPTIAPYGMKQLYLTDPDGYGLCFQWPAEK